MEKPKNTQQINIDISTMENHKCPTCDSSTFIKAIELRKIPSVVSKSGKPEVAQIDLLICADCSRKVSKVDIFGESSNLV